MKKGKVTGISGVSESRASYVIAERIKQNKGKSLIITATGPRAREMADDLSFFVGRRVHILPQDEGLLMGYEARSHEQVIERMRGIGAFLREEDAILVAPASAAVKKIMPHRQLAEKKLTIAMGDELDPAAAGRILVELGYEPMGMVEARGEFSLRGGILDVFTPDADYPYRIEFFGTEVDSIRTFDEDTQRSVETLKFVEIRPVEQMLVDEDLFRKAGERISKEYTAQTKKLAKKESEIPEGEKSPARTLEQRRDELLEHIRTGTNIQMLENYIHYFYEDTEYLWDYLEEGCIYIEDPDRIGDMLESRENTMEEDFRAMLTRGELVPGDAACITGKKDFLKIYDAPGAGSGRQRDLCAITPFSKQVEGIREYDDLKSYRSLQLTDFAGHMELLEQELRTMMDRDYDIRLVCSTPERKNNLKEFCERAGLYSDEKGDGEGAISFVEGSLSRGFQFSDEKLCYISDSDIFGQRTKARRRRRRIEGGSALTDLSDLSRGDFVVHESHGIGKFDGIVQLTVLGEKKDYLKIVYAGGDLLYIPVEQFDVVQKYIGAEGIPPKINRLSGTDWRAAKAKARKAIAEMTDELVELYAERELAPGYAFGPDTVWQSEFEDSFPFEETEDQLKSAEEIKRDMEKPVAMDRLLCGDVGYGKTEVAARAMFKCVTEGKQAAILVPTTVLANQHYYTLKERFQNFPIRVEMLSRFRSPGRQKEILKELEKGEIDLIVGTHRLLSKDVKFKDLGLLVVDEEHRFGVKHKETIKKLKKNVDVLTLSATPIPRTLNMSLTGIKDMSIISEPPEERYPVQTYVMEQSNQVIKDAIQRELDRNGQIFVIFNRVSGISSVANRIRALVPEARIGVGHGRMSEKALEDIIMDFVNHEIDILVSTTIVESGIDIPAANTMIVLDADRYGLAQLYQLRGRVGRSNRLAYAYLMYQRDKVLTEISEKRLRSIREFTEFGAGFKIAMRDLEIRGAGNLLGSQQSGHMMNIGYELYCKMVEEQVRKIRERAAVNGELPNFSGDEADSETETSIEISGPAIIPSWYIDDESLKLSMYKKIAEVTSEEEEMDLMDEFIDRFGDVPRETANLLKISRIRTLAGKCGCLRIHEQDKDPIMEGYRTGGGRPGGRPAPKEKVIFNFAGDGSLSPYAIININGEFGSRAFVHGGVKPYIRLTTHKEGKLTDIIRLLEIAAENRS